jgi:hypothetical protein
MLTRCDSCIACNALFPADGAMRGKAAALRFATHRWPRLRNNTAANIVLVRGNSSLAAGERFDFPTWVMVDALLKKFFCEKPDAIRPEAWKQIYWTMVSADIC